MTEQEEGVSYPTEAIQRRGEEQSCVELTVLEWNHMWPRGQLQSGTPRGHETTSLAVCMHGPPSHEGRRCKGGQRPGSLQDSLVQLEETFPRDVPFN